MKSDRKYELLCVMSCVCAYMYSPMVYVPFVHALYRVFLCALCAVCCSVVIFDLVAGEEKTVDRKAVETFVANCNDRVVDCREEIDDLFGKVRAGAKVHTHTHTHTHTHSSITLSPCPYRMLKWVRKTLWCGCRHAQPSLHSPNGCWGRSLTS